MGMVMALKFKFFNFFFYSESESESSVASAPLTKKISDKKPADKTNNSTKSESKDHPANSDSDIENKATSNVVRKLTRSSSTRKSKHLTGKKKQNFLR